LKILKTEEEMSSEERALLEVGIIKDYLVAKHFGGECPNAYATTRNKPRNYTHSGTKTHKDTDNFLSRVGEVQ
jgi:hypothetical protein